MQIAVSMVHPIDHLLQHGLRIGAEVAESRFYDFSRKRLSVASCHLFCDGAGEQPARRAFDRPTGASRCGAFGPLATPPLLNAKAFLVGQL